MRFVVKTHEHEPPSLPSYEVVERVRAFPLAVVTERHVATFHSRASAHVVADELNAQRREGIVEGLTRFAWWQSGEQMVGTCGTTLKQAIADLDREGC
jgi:hypothetical protein